jgi:hypothetical protein
MNFRYLLLGAAVLMVAGVSASANAAEKKDSVMVEPSWKGMNSGPPPALGEDKQTPEEAQKEAQEKLDKAVLDHYKRVYGSEEGPFTGMAEQEKLAEEGRKKIARYGMTPEQRAAADAAEAAQAAAAGQKPGAAATGASKPAGGYVYKPKAKTDAPPRLFNNVTP